MIDWHRREKCRQGCVFRLEVSRVRLYVQRMLQTLRVRNLALVEDITVEFGPGLNVITGETGAGKSVIIGALGLLLGERADKTLIRAGADQCVAEAVFRLEDTQVLDGLLEDVGLPRCEDGALVVRRTISAGGGGRNLVNDGAATIQVLKRIGEMLVDMHGPYDHQSLFHADFQLEILDAFGGLRAARRQYEAHYHNWRALQMQRQEIGGASDEEVFRQVELLSFQKKEIEDAAPVEGEEEAVIKEQTTVANAQRILELANTIRDALMEGDQSVFPCMAVAQKALGEMAPLLEEAETWRQEIRALAMQVQDLSKSIDRVVSHVEGDPRRLEWLEERMATYHRLKRKYGATIPQILEHLAVVRRRLAELENRGQRLAEVDAEIVREKRQMELKAAVLGKARRQAASKLEKAITAELRDLGFLHGCFSIQIEACDAGPLGMDKVEFLFAPNAGEPSRSLRAIASSGEISRVMLAVKSVLASHDRIPVLVFDEIDANVGGGMGTAIGRKLENVGKLHQVLCITHLPQVAMCGSSHYAVVKELVVDRTRTRIVPLEGEQRVEEIARMLGGRNLTSVTLKHAREMLKRAE